MDFKELYLSGLSIPEVSEKTGIAKSTIRFRLKKLGILRTRQEGILNASKRGILGSGLRGKKRVFTDSWKANMSKAKLAAGGIGYSLKPSGYLEITMGENKGRSQHVVIMEEHIGRKLFSDEVVHHINHVKTDNRIENLELMTRSEHASHHAKENNPKRVRDSKGRYK